MSKHTRLKEVSVCDWCGKDGCFRSCIGCGRDVCYECKNAHGVEYNAGVSFSGSGDGFYCHECNAAALKGGDKLNAAYRNILSLRNEREGWYRAFGARQKEAEDRLQKLLGMAR